MVQLGDVYGLYIAHTHGAHTPSLCVRAARVKWNMMMKEEKNQDGVRPSVREKYLTWNLDEKIDHNSIMEKCLSACVLSAKLFSWIWREIQQQNTQHIWFISQFQKYGRKKKKKIKKMQMKRELLKRTLHRMDQKLIKFEFRCYLQIRYYWWHRISQWLQLLTELSKNENIFVFLI